MIQVKEKAGLTYTCKEHRRCSIIVEKKEKKQTYPRRGSISRRQKI